VALSDERLAVLIADFDARELRHLGFYRWLTDHGLMLADTVGQPTFPRVGDPGDESGWDPASAGSA
jgi:hypothetical protein